MLKFLCPKTTALLLVLYCTATYGQLVGSGPAIWEKANTTSRKPHHPEDGNLLNFHPGIKDQLLKKYLELSQEKSHTLCLVHSSRDDEKIWLNEGNKVSLSNYVYEKKESEKDIKIRKRPSLFTSTGTAVKYSGISGGSILKFEDRNLYEMILLPRKATRSDLHKIHSYLSLKYGISLEEGDYYASDGEIIWEREKQKEFRYRPTGLGRDDGNELYQKQSSNQEDQFLTIGKTDIMNINTENASRFDHNSFVMWSDNNKEMKTKIEGNFNVLERSWKINFIGSAISRKDYKVRIDKKTVNPSALRVSYWMFLTGNNGKTIRLQGVENGNHIEFGKVDFERDKKGLTSYFTFALGPVADQKKDRDNNSGSFSIEAGNLSLDSQQISLYPNPVKKGQNFTVSFPAMEGLVISIYDGGGRLIKMEKIDQKSTSYTLHLSTQSSYLIILTQEGKMIKTFKLIVD